MKTIKQFVICLALMVTAFSCSDNDPVGNQENPTSSVSLRIALNEIKKANNITGRSASDFCFDFVYPITLSYSNGTTVTASNMDGLIEILMSESSNLYISGIVFPFQIMQDGAISTIDTEAEFAALLEACGFDTLEDEFQNSYCFDVVFPITGFSGNTPITITTMQEFEVFANNSTANTPLQLTFPISAYYNGQVVVISNIYEFYEMVSNCYSCICQAIYAPVCVQTPVGIVEYGNMCHAECAGYTQNDLVPCNQTPACTIGNVSLVNGSCIGNGMFSATLNFNHTNASTTNFSVYTENMMIGTFQLASLPVTVNLPSAASAQNLVIIIDGGTTTNCSASIQFESPDCNPVPYNFGTLLGTCFQVNFPVQVMHQGAVYTVSQNGQLLQYYFPAVSPMPYMVYPISVSFGNTSYTFNSQAEFEAQIAASCN